MHPKPLHLPAIVLAAGLSSRMGDFKPLLELAGEKLLLRVIRSLLSSGTVSEAIVVTGHKRELVEHAVGDMPGVRCVFNPDFAAGEMLSSLRVGIAALAAGGSTPRHPAFILSFADQPAVRPVTIGALADHFAAHPDVPLVLPTHAGKRGHPILLSAALFPEIANLQPHETLRTVVHRHLTAAALLEVPDPAILEDLDTPADLARAAARMSGS